MINDRAPQWKKIIYTHHDEQGYYIYGLVQLCLYNVISLLCTYNYTTTPWLQLELHDYIYINANYYLQGQSIILNTVYMNSSTGLTHIHTLSTEDWYLLCCHRRNGFCGSVQYCPPFWLMDCPGSVVGESESVVQSPLWLPSFPSIGVNTLCQTFVEHRILCDCQLHPVVGLFSALCVSLSSVVAPFLWFLSL